jgi:exonuclease SbcC
MVGEQRRETEKVLRSLIGDLDTLLRTSFAAQGQLTNFITMNPGSRKEILYSLLRLDAFDDFAKECRDMVGGIKGKLDMIPDVDFDEKIASLELEVKELESTRKKVSKSLEQGKELLVDLAGMLRDELDETDFKKLKRAQGQVESLQEQLASLTTSREALVVRLGRGRVGLTEANDLLESLDIEGVKSQLEEIDRFSGELDSLQGKLKLQRDLHTRLQKSVEILDSVPCEDQFPTCRFIERSIKDRDSLDHQTNLVESMESDVRTLRSTLLGRDRDDLLRKKRLYEDAQEQVKNYEVQLHKLDLDLSQVDSTLSTRRDELRHSEEELALLEAKTSPDKAQRHVALLAQQEQLKGKLSALESKLFGLSERIGAAKSDVEKYASYARTKQELNAEWAVYDLLKALFSRKGLPSDVLEGCLPTINSMLKQLLLEDVEFTVELVLSGDSKKLEVMLDYGDSKRIIECCSGMEKMIASLAIRGALHVVSRLPKPDFFVVDEGFGALDESNIEPCVRMLRHLLKVFRYVIVISHVDTVKDSVDTMIEIGRNGLDSVVKH